MSIQAYHLFLRVFPIYKGCWWGCTTFMFFKSFKNRLQKKTRIPLKCFQDSASILLEFYLIYSSIFYFKTSNKTFVQVKNKSFKKGNWKEKTKHLSLFIWFYSQRLPLLTISLSFWKVCVYVCVCVCVCVQNWSTIL